MGLSLQLLLVFAVCGTVVMATSAEVKQAEEKALKKEESPIDYETRRKMAHINTLRRKAPKGHFYSLDYNEYVKCDTYCKNGTDLTGECGMDCRYYYLSLDLKKKNMDDQIIREFQSQTIKNLREKIQETKDTNEAQKKVLIIGFVFVILLLFILICWTKINQKLTLKKIKKLQEEIKELKPHGAPTDDQEGGVNNPLV